jgi:hypothetical protein
MINYQAQEAFLLINTINPSNMYQFTFPQGSSIQLLQLTQVLSVHSLPAAPLADLIDFIDESFVSNQEHYHLIDITVTNGQLHMPAEFGLAIQNVDFVEPDLHIMTQFNIKAESFTNNPVTIGEMDSFPSLAALKAGARTRGVLPDARPLIWPVIFDILPFDSNRRATVIKARVSEYLAVRAQWETLSKTQLKYIPVVRDAFATIRVDVKRTHPPAVITAIPHWDDLLIRILRTFTMWNLDVRYTQGLNDLAVVFMTVFMPSTAWSPEEAEALTFWCFAAFVEVIGSGLIAENMMTMQLQEFVQIMGIIDKFHPGCAKWLRTNGLGDLSFLISAFILAYGRSFPPETITRVWEALVTGEAPWLFLRYFSASLLIFSFPSFHQVRNCSTGKLVSLMDQLLGKQDVGAVIGVSLSMMQNSTAAVQAEIRNRQQFVAKPDTVPEPQKKMFAPITRFAAAYREAGNLFT